MSSQADIRGQSIEFVPRSHAMELLDVRKDFLLNLQKEGLLPWYVVGKKVFYKISDINNLIRKGKQI